MLKMSASNFHTISGCGYTAVLILYWPLTNHLSAPLTTPKLRLFFIFPLSSFSYIFICCAIKCWIICLLYFVCNCVGDILDVLYFVLCCSFCYSWECVPFGGRVLTLHRCSYVSLLRRKVPRVAF